MNSKAIKLNAKYNINRQYWTAVGLYALLIISMSVSSTITAGLAVIFLLPHFMVGMDYGFTRLYRGELLEINHIFSPFSRYGRVMGGMWWMYLWVYLWSLLFIIPGIIKSFSYAMTPYILGDSPNVPAKEALKISMRMMEGHKMELFVFYLSFIGWMILSSLTFGILQFFYVGPYMETSLAGFYVERRRESVLEGRLTPEQLFWLNS